MKKSQDRAAEPLRLTGSQTLTTFPDRDRVDRLSAFTPDYRVGRAQYSTLQNSGNAERVPL